MKCLKQLVLVLVIGVLCLSGTLDGQAASKEEQHVLKEYRSFKFGLTVTQVAKIMYGASYKQHLKQKNGATVFKKKANWAQNEKGYRSRGYSFYDKSKTLPRLMTLEFHTRKNQTTYFLVQKTLQFAADTNSGLRESTRMLKHVTYIRGDETEAELDELLSGKGLGQVGLRWSLDYKSVQTKQERKEYKYRGQMKIYTFKSSNPKKQIEVMMKFDYQKKQYVMNNYSIHTIKPK